MIDKESDTLFEVELFLDFVSLDAVCFDVLHEKIKIQANKNEKRRIQHCLLNTPLVLINFILERKIILLC